jgi:hypothetical protein
LGLLTLLIAEDPTDRIPTLLTARPEFHPTWGCWTHVTSLTRERLSSIKVEQMIDRATGGSACRLRSGKRIV